MPLSLRPHVLPIGVTCIGLLIAGALAWAPVLMQDDATDILAATNKTDIAKLSEQLQTMSTELDSKLAALDSAMNSRLSDLEIQVVTLNKAVGRLSVKLANQALHQTSSGQVPVSTTLTLLDDKAYSADTRIDTLEKAVGRLHQRYRSAATTVEDRNVEIDRLLDVRKKLGALLRSLSQ